MSDKTLIAWTDHTFNPWMGCIKVSPGCAHCYAETLTRDRMGLKLWGPGSRRQVTTDQNWRKPVKWNKEAAAAGQRKRVFCASLCDVFEEHPTADEARPRLWDLIRSTPWLDWQLLTKRPHNVVPNLPADWRDGYANVWIGFSTEDQQRANERVPFFDTFEAVVKFTSYEPALGAIDYHQVVGGRTLLERIDWCIYGGESGPGYRPHDLAWPRQARDQFAADGRAFFFKQSAAYRTEMGIELDGQIVRNYPTPREVAHVQ